MPMFMGVAAKFAADFLSGIINGIVNKWMQMRESRKRGEAESKNAAHEENAKRKVSMFGDRCRNCRSQTNCFQSLREAGRG